MLSNNYCKGSLFSPAWGAFAEETVHESGKQATKNWEVSLEGEEVEKSQLGPALLK